MSFRLTENRPRVPAVPLAPLAEAAGWRAEEMAASDQWIYHLSDPEIAELTRTVERASAAGGDIKDVTLADFELPTLGPALADIRGELIDGRGFVLIRGVPVADYSRAQSALAFWGIGLHLGRPVSQNAEGHLLGHVKDIGGDYSDAKTRGYTSSAAMGFHTDRCDYVGLMCLQPAKQGGESRIASSVALYNEMLKRRPDLAEELIGDFYWTRHGEISPGEDPYYAYPVFAFEQGMFSGRGVSTHIYKSQALPGVPQYTEKQIEALDLFKAMVQELSFDMEFRQGDIQFLQNHVILHSRRGFEDWPEPDRRRHLLRLWVSDPAARPVPEIYRKIISGINVEGVEPNTPLDVDA
jgi:hypothetical protein